MKYVILRNGSRLRIPLNGGKALLKMLRARGALAPEEKAEKPVAKLAKAAKAPKAVAPVVQAETEQEAVAAPPAPVPAKRATKSRAKSSE